MNAGKIEKIFKKFVKRTNLDLDIKNEKNDSGFTVVSCGGIVTIDDCIASEIFLFFHVDCTNDLVSLSFDFSGSNPKDLAVYEKLNHLNDDNLLKFVLSDDALEAGNYFVANDESCLETNIDTFISLVTDPDLIKEINDIVSDLGPVDD